MLLKKNFKGFIFFWKGLQAANREMWVSVQVLLVLTLVLSIPLYFFEHAAQPDVYESLWDSIVWSFMGYLGNPGKFACGDPITIPGRFLWIIISIIKLALFAIPAGLVANGFRAAMAKDKRDNELNEYRDRLHKLFRRVQHRPTLFREVPVYKGVVEIQAKMGMDVKDIIDVAERFPEFRLCDLSMAETTTEHPIGRLAVQMRPVTEDIPYGCRIDRNSPITIVCPTAANEIGLGYFSYYLALYGGFNYISKEVKCDRDDNFSYYNIDPDREDANIGKFVEDIRSMSSGDGKWVIYIIAAENHEELVHFVDGPKKGCDDIEDPKVTILKKDQETYLSVVEGITEMLSIWSSGSIAATRQKYYGAASSKHISRHVGVEGRSQFTIRIDYKIAVWNSTATGIIYDMANILRKQILGEEPLCEDCVNQWKSVGRGY